MAASIIMNQIIVGRIGGGSIRMLHGTTLPDVITPRAIFAVTEEAVSGMIMQADAPEHSEGLIWIEIASVTEQVIGSDGEEAVELIAAWISTEADWAPLEAYHSATGEWMQFSAAALPIPEYTYTGSHQLIDDGDGNWRIKFLTSGTLTLLDRRDIDVFLVGGGGGGGQFGGAGGGYTYKDTALVLPNTPYAIAIGAGGTVSGTAGSAGGTTSAFNFAANGGRGTSNTTGGAGGSGGGGANTGASSTGYGGSDGSNGSAGSYAAGVGQHTTTREFHETTGVLYAGGGGGSSNQSTPGAGGAGGGGKGTGNTGGGAAAAGTANTGGGGGGGFTSGGARGGSGIVIIRNAR